MQTDKGTSNGHLDTRPCHQSHCRCRQSNALDIDTERNSMLVCKRNLVFPVSQFFLQNAQCWMNWWLTLTGCTWPCRCQTPSLSLKNLGSGWLWVSPGVPPFPVVCLQRNARQFDDETLERSLPFFEWRGETGAAVLTIFKAFCCQSDLHPGFGA